MDEYLAVVIPIYSGAESDITGGALYFHSFANPSDWHITIPIRKFMSLERKSSGSISRWWR